MAGNKDFAYSTRLSHNFEHEQKYKPTYDGPEANTGRIFVQNKWFSDQIVSGDDMS